jgi:protein-histidine pros-kinase
MGTLVSGFIVIAVLLNVLLHRLAIKPIMAISRTANDVSVGKTETPNVDWPAKDEIGDLYKSFNRIRRSLETAMRLLR